MSEKGFEARMRTGYVVFGALAVATVVEYLVAISGMTGSLLLLAAIALAKAWLIVDYFMHIRALREERGR